MILQLKTTLVTSQILFILHLKNMHTDFYVKWYRMHKQYNSIVHKLTTVAGDLPKINEQYTDNQHKELWLIRLPPMYPPIEGLFTLFT